MTSKNSRGYIFTYKLSAKQLLNLGKEFLNGLLNQLVGPDLPNLVLQLLEAQQEVLVQVWLLHIEIFESLHDLECLCIIFLLLHMIRSKVFTNDLFIIWSVGDLLLNRVVKMYLI